MTPSFIFPTFSIFDKTQTYTEESKACKEFAYRNRVSLELMSENSGHKGEFVSDSDMKSYQLRINIKCN